MTLTPCRGRRLGEFVLAEKLDEGGFGEVYRAHQPSLGRDAVVKIARTGATERFLREARLAAQIDHPYAAHVYAFGSEPDGTLWIAMEHVRGTPLSRMLAVNGPLPLDRFVPLFERLCEVVHAVHERGIVHRDLKPANIIVVAHAGRLLPKLIDLGIAGYAEQLEHDGSIERDDTHGRITNSGQLLGSPGYMAPEQWRDPSRVDRRADIYALGLVAYECLAGAPAFAGNQRELRALHHDAPPPVLPLGLSARLSQELARALSKEALDRHPTAIALATAVRAASGVAAHVIDLPRLPPALLERVLATAPRPIADAAALVAGAASLRELRRSLELATRSIVRFLGAVAIAARSRLVVNGGELEPARALLDELLRRPLSDDEWHRLATTLCEPLCDVRDAFPIPEVLDFITGVRPGRDALAMLVASAAVLDDDAERRALAQGVRDLASTLDAMQLFDGYTLAVDETALSGVSRGDPLPEVGAVRLFGPDRDTVVDFGPLVRIAPAVPGSPPELFVFDGRGGRGGTMRSARGYELAGDEAWTWLARLWPTDESDAAALVDASPYPGLVAFTVEDAGRFFGRDRELAAFRNRLRATPLLAIVGASGAGKSSFALAGVAADLIAEWHPIVIRPGIDPVRALIAELAPLDASTTPNKLEAQVMADPTAFGRRLRDLASIPPRGTVSGRDGRGILLVIDQFEELFTACRDDARRTAFARTLDAAAQAAGDPVRVVITVRDDFLARTQELGALRDRIANGLFLLSTPSRAELIRIAAEPARRAGYKFDDPGLPTRMADEVAGRPTALPLLAFTAARLWELRDPNARLLRANAYAAIGGVSGALVRHAEATFVALTAGDQKQVRALFGALVTSEGARSTLSRADAVGIAGDERIVEALVASRLLSARDTHSGEQLELVHEALVVEWPRLAGWRDADRLDARLRDQLREGARGWDERGRHAGLLWSGDALAEIARSLRDDPRTLPAVEAAFIDASRAQARQVRRVRRAMIATAFGLLAIAVVILLQLRGTAEEQRGHAEQLAATAQRELIEQLEARGRRASLDGRTAEAAENLVRAYDLGLRGDGLAIMLQRVARARDAELRVLAVGESVIWAELSPDGTRVLTVGFASGRVVVWDAATGRPIAEEHGAGLPSMAHFDASGARIAIPGSAPRIWTVADGTTVAIPIDRDRRVTRIAFGPDDTIVTQANDALELWRASTGAPITRFPLSIPRTSQFAIAGHAIVVADRTTVTVWSPAGAPTAVLNGTDAIFAVAGSDDGSIVAAAGADGTVRVWDVATRTQVALVHEGSRIDRISISATGAHVLTTGESGAKLWDRSGRLVRAFAQRQGRLAVAEVDPSARRLLLGASDGLLCLYDLSSGELARCLEGHRGKIHSGSFGANDIVVTAGADGTARLWRAQLSTHTVMANRWLHDLVAAGSAALASCDMRGGLNVWDMATARLKWATSWTSSPGEPECLALEIDRERVLAIRTTGMKVFDVRTGATLATVDAHKRYSTAALLDDGVVLGTNGGVVERRTLAGTLFASARLHRGQVVRLAVSPDRTRIAAAGDDATVTILDARSGALIRRLAGHELALEEVAFDPAGRRLATTSADRTTRIWDITTGKQLHVLPSLGMVHVARFTRDGLRLLTSHEDGSVQVWSSITGARLRVLREHVGAVWTLALIPGRDLAISGSTDGSTILWDLERLGAVLRLQATETPVLGATYVDGRIAVGSWDASRLWPFAIADLHASVEQARSMRASHADSDD